MRLHLVAATLAAIATTARSADARADAASLAAAGRFSVGTATLTLVDTTRPTAASGTYPGSAVRTLPTDVYYPAVSGTAGAVTRDAAFAAAKGPFPLVVFAHGLGGARTDFAGTLAHLASRGYVAVAPDFPLTNVAAFAGGTVSLADVVNQPGDVSFEIDAFTGNGIGAAAPFAAAVDAKRVGLFGHSYGGATTLLAVFGGPLADARIQVAAAIAPFSCAFGPAMFTPRRIPVLIVQGTDDALIDPFWSRTTFAAMPAPKVFVEIAGADHLGFTSSPALGALRDRDVLGLFNTVLQNLPGGLATQGAALTTALAAVPGADFAPCLSRAVFPDPATETDPLLAHAEQQRISDVALTALFESVLHHQRAARRVLTAFARRSAAKKIVRSCTKLHGHGTCRDVEPAA